MSEEISLEYNPKGMPALQSGVVSSVSGGALGSASAGVQKTLAQADINGALLVNVAAAGSASAGANPIIGAAIEQVSSPSITSGAVYSSGFCLGAPVTISNGGSLRDISVGWNTSQTVALSCLVLRGSCSTATTLLDHSAANIAVGDAGKVIGAVTLTSGIIPGASGTTWLATGVDIVVSSGAQIVLIAGGTMNSAGGATSGLTVGAGIV